MALFRIKNKGLRWLTGGVLILALIAVVVAIAYLLGLGAGYGFRAIGIDLFAILLFADKEISMGDTFALGSFAIAGLYLIGLFVWGARKVGNECFNSIGDKKEEKADGAQS